MNTNTSLTSLTTRGAALKALGACNDGIKFAVSTASMAEAWEACERSDWMLWLLRSTAGLQPTETEFRLLACWFARNTPLADGRTTWDLLTDARSRTAIEVAERYCTSLATKEELQKARSGAAAGAAGAASADAAYAAADAAAADATYAAVYAADAAAYAVDAAYDAAYAAYAADDAAGAGADAVVAHTKANKAQCDHIRSFIGNPFPAICRAEGRS